jgi:hypothetical protein
MSTHRKDMQDLRLTVVATVPDDEGYCVDYVVYEACYFDEVTPVSWRPADDCNGVTDDLAKAQVFLHGHVKWDGCSNWHFDIDDGIMLHACERWELVRVGEVMARCWDWTKELLPNFDGD